MPHPVLVGKAVRAAINPGQGNRLRAVNGPLHNVKIRPSRRVRSGRQYLARRCRRDPTSSRRRTVGPSTRVQQVLPDRLFAVDRRIGPSASWRCRVPISMPCSSTPPFTSVSDGNWYRLRFGIRSLRSMSTNRTRRRSASTSGWASLASDARRSMARADRTRYCTSGLIQRTNAGPARSARRVRTTRPGAVACAGRRSRRRSRRC